MAYGASAEIKGLTRPPLIALRQLGKELHGTKRPNGQNWMDSMQVSRTALSLALFVTSVLVMGTVGWRAWISPGVIALYVLCWVPVHLAWLLHAGRPLQVPVIPVRHGMGEHTCCVPTSKGHVACG